ncbi:hypothetical protein AB0F72_35960 [Actinoplanes sp. NPDC023936]|uniref:hypothetical protein n=1 Tax=Actinoplanes sp. NPDC023936 TaxID=3154910 RepID=UPI003410BAFD
MDLWDLTKMLFRRWYIFAPVLLASLALVLVTAQAIKPDYSATGHLQLIPPNERVEKGQVVKVNNRWLDLGFPALGSAVILQSQTEEVLSKLTEAGYTDNFTVTMEYGTTYLTIEAIGTTEQQAVGTVQQLMKVLDDLVGELQTQFNTKEQDQISTLALDRGDNVEAVTSKKKRVIIVAAGLAVMLSVGLSISIDAFIRMRRRRVGEDPVAPSVKSAAVTPPPSVATGVTMPSADATVVLQTPASISRATARAERGRDADQTVRVFTSTTSRRPQGRPEEEPARNGEMAARAEFAARAQQQPQQQPQPPQSGRPASQNQQARPNSQASIPAAGQNQQQGRPNGQASVPVNGQSGHVGRQELRQ